MIKPLIPFPLDRSCKRECAAFADSNEAMVVTLPCVLRLERVPFETESDFPLALSSVNDLHFGEGSLGSLKMLARFWTF